MRLALGSVRCPLTVRGSRIVTQGPLSRARASFAMPSVARLASPRTATAVLRFFPVGNHTLDADLVLCFRSVSQDLLLRPVYIHPAQSLINLFPGESLAAKAFSVLFSSSIAAYLISKEVYILDGEMFEVLTMFGAYYLWYQGGKEGFVEYFSERQNTMRNILTAAREQHKAVVKERMDHIGKLANSVEVTKGLFDISKAQFAIDIARLEAEAYELQQRVSYTNEVKSVLDSWVRHETAVREKEQKLMAEAVIAKIRAELSDPRMIQQSNILNQTLADVENLAKTK
ncbi:atp4 subunit B of the stator stalk of mitochondrial F1F0 ATP synthase [Entophlyctis sp. JEL0112]|nr:atp4 subunit B of the stator stalk of mitochondrial F1F0 ATP synthase [Entophlyctis sp. JEL0112]